MNLLLVAEHGGDNDELVRAVQTTGWALTAEVGFAGLDHILTDSAVDAVVLVSRRVDATVLEAVRTINDRRPLPVLLFTGDSLQKSIRAAVSAGVSAYVVDCTDISRLGSLLDVAVARFEQTQRLIKELRKAKASLAERGAVEKAKGIIMRQRSISEDAAYQLLRKLAMDRNRRIGEVADDVIAAARVLI